MTKFDEIKQRCDAATPGKWSFREADSDTYFDCYTDVHILDKYGGDYSIIAALGQSADSYWIRNPGDKELIENAGTDMRLLLKALELAKKDIQTLSEYSSAPLPPKMLEGLPDYWLDRAAAYCPQCDSKPHKMDCTDESNKHQTVTMKAGECAMNEPVFKCSFCDFTSELSHFWLEDDGNGEDDGCARLYCENCYCKSDIESEVSNEAFS